MQDMLQGRRTHKTFTKLMPSEYTNRHSKVAGYIHWTIWRHMGLQVTSK